MDPSMALRRATLEEVMTVLNLRARQVRRVDCAAHASGDRGKDPSEDGHALGRTGALALGSNAL